MKKLIIAMIAAMSLSVFAFAEETKMEEHKTESTTTAPEAKTEKKMDHKMKKSKKAAKKGHEAHEAHDAAPKAE